MVKLRQTLRMEFQVRSMRKYRHVVGAVTPCKHTVTSQTRTSPYVTRMLSLIAIRGQVLEARRPLVYDNDVNGALVGAGPKSESITNHGSFDYYNEWKLCPRISIPIQYQRP